MRSLHTDLPDYAFYPTARQFGSHFGIEHLQRCIRQSNAEPVPRDLAIGVLGPRKDDIAQTTLYTEHLAAEAALVGALFDVDREVTEIAVDASATRTLAEDGMRAVLDRLRGAFHFADEVDLQFAVESRNVARSEIDTMVELGATRMRIALHECDGRGAAAPKLPMLEGAWRTIGHCAKHQRTGLNLDLFLGCAGQTHASFATTLELAIANQPFRITLPSCSYSAAQPLAETWRELAIERLVAAGYVYLGLGQLVAAEDPLAQARLAKKLRRTLLGYTARAECDVVGLGAGAISRIGDSLSQNFDLERWREAVTAGHLAVARGRLLDYDDIVRGTVIDELMCHGEIAIGALERRFALDFPTYFADALAQIAPLEDAGIVAHDAACISATSRGRGQLRMIAACFDRYHDTNSR